MLVLDKDEFLQVIDENDYTSFEVYDGHISENSIKEKMGLEKFIKKEATIQECTERIKNFLNRRPGKYTFVLKQNAHTPIIKSVRLLIDTTEPLKVQTYEEEISRSIDVIKEDLNSEQLEQLIEARVQAIMIEKERQREIEEKNARLQKFETSSGKLAIVFEKILMNLMMQPGSKVMQGTHTETEQEKTHTKEEIIKAFNKLGNVLGVETIINLANKIDKEENKHLIPMIKNFASN